MSTIPDFVAYRSDIIQSIFCSLWKGCISLLKTYNRWLGVTPSRTIWQSHWQPQYIYHAAQTIFLPLTVQPFGHLFKIWDNKALESFLRETGLFQVINILHEPADVSLVWRAIGYIICQETTLCHKTPLHWNTKYLYAAIDVAYSVVS